MKTRLRVRIVKTKSKIWGTFLSRFSTSRSVGWLKTQHWLRVTDHFYLSFPLPFPFLGTKWHLEDLKFALGKCAFSLSVCVCVNCMSVVSLLHITGLPVDRSGKREKRGLFMSVEETWTDHKKKGEKNVLNKNSGERCTYLGYSSPILTNSARPDKRPFLNGVRKAATATASTTRN